MYIVVCLIVELNLAAVTINRPWIFFIIDLKFYCKVVLLVSVTRLQSLLLAKVANIILLISFFANYHIMKNPYCILV